MEKLQKYENLDRFTEFCREIQLFSKILSYVAEFIMVRNFFNLMKKIYWAKKSFFYWDIYPAAVQIGRWTDNW